MKNRIIIINVLLFIFYANANAQSTIENVLAQISKNNKTIHANEQYYEAQRLQYKTGNSPSNPSVEYDFFSGTPASAGNQHELLIVQSFDFPTAYIKKSQLEKTRTAQTEFQLLAERQNVLLEAKKYCLELVYQNKLQRQLVLQKQNTEKILQDLQTKLVKGEGNILDVNKAKLQLIEVKKLFQDNISEINQLNQKLTEYNGGVEILFPDTVYPILTAIPSFSQLEGDYENADPLLKILQHEKLVSQKQLELSKALWLPKMELGYHYQGFLGQTFNGIHTGITIPLWENNNVGKQKQAQVIYSDLELQAHINEHYFHIKHIYEKYSNLKVTLEEYRAIFNTLNNNALLNKALALGEMTTIQYFTEINYYNSAFNNYLTTEKEYYQTIADLYKYQL